MDWIVCGSIEMHFVFSGLLRSELKMEIFHWIIRCVFKLLPLPPSLSVSHCPFYPPPKWQCKKNANKPNQHTQAFECAERVSTRFLAIPICYVLIFYERQRKRWKVHIAHTQICWMRALLHFIQRLIEDCIVLVHVSIQTKHRQRLQVHNANGSARKRGKRQKQCVSVIIDKTIMICSSHGRESQSHQFTLFLFFCVYYMLLLWFSLMRYAAYSKDVMQLPEIKCHMLILCFFFSLLCVLRKRKQQQQPNALLYLNDTSVCWIAWLRCKN